MSDGNGYNDWEEEAPPPQLTPEQQRAYDQLNGIWLRDVGEAADISPEAGQKFVSEFRPWLESGMAEGKGNDPEFWKDYRKQVRTFLRSEEQATGQPSASAPKPFAQKELSPDRYKSMTHEERAKAALVTPGRG